MLMKFGIVALSGAIGTAARFGMVTLFQRIAGETFPWGTMAVNLIGCFCAGMLWMLFEGRWEVTPEIRLLVLVRFMGAFTTFSSLILESGTFMSTARWWTGILNLIAHNIIGLGALFAGMHLGKLV